MTLQSQIQEIDRHLIKYDENNEANFNVIIKAEGDIEELKPLDFKVLANYKEINFEVDGLKYDTYKLDVSKKGEFIIPIKISKQDIKGVNELMIYAIEGDYEKSGNNTNIANIEDLYEVEQQNKSLVDKNIIEAKTKYEIEIDTDYLFSINFDQNPDLEDFLKSKSNLTTTYVQENKEIEVNVRQKNFSGNGQQLMFAQMDDKVIKIDNQDYVIYSMDNACTAFLDKVRIMVPSKSGVHRLNFISIIKDSEGNITNILNSNSVSVEVE